jgi:Holliday junction resolvase-like predicted endonuclease
MRTTPSMALIERVYRAPLRDVLATEIRKRRTVEGALTAINKKTQLNISRATAYIWMRTLDMSAVDIKREEN